MTVVGTVAAAALRRFAPWLALAALAGGGGLYVRALRADLAAAETVAAVARAEADTVAARAAQIEASGRLALRWAALHAERERRMQANVVRLSEEVRHAAQPIPAACRPVLQPLAAAARGLRALRSEAAAARRPDDAP